MRLVYRNFDEERQVLQGQGKSKTNGHKMRCFVSGCVGYMAKDRRPKEASNGTVPYPTTRERKAQENERPV